MVICRENLLYIQLFHNRLMWPQLSITRNTSRYSFMCLWNMKRIKLRAFDSFLSIEILLISCWNAYLIHLCTCSEICHLLACLCIFTAFVLVAYNCSVVSGHEDPDIHILAPCKYLITLGIEATPNRISLWHVFKDSLKHDRNQMSVHTDWLTVCLVTSMAIQEMYKSQG